jgi:2-polyprenyl-3-methyl-5-hydroxy-6-metoxy-1,4-benzoquinol methylase
MDELARYNKKRWEALAGAGITFSRPRLDLNEQTARELLDPYGIMGDVAGSEVLCLASGGGQQSVAFALLGARVTVLDLSETQLERDAEAAAHYGLEITRCQGDMRDLSRFGQAAFDQVYHAHSLNFVPDPRVVFDQVVQVLRPGGLYRLSYTNPFIHGMLGGTEWNGTGYAVRSAYADGAEMTGDDRYWKVEDATGQTHCIEGPRQFRHTLSTVVNSLIERGFEVRGIWEDDSGDPEAEPGTWEHFKAMFPPWLVIWTRYRS